MIIHNAFTNEPIYINCRILSYEKFNVSLNKHKTRYVTKLVTKKNIYLVKETVEWFNKQIKPIN